MLLQVKGINTYYGLSHILFDVSLEVDRGEVVVLLGRNGAGKTTTMRSIMGLTAPKNGTVTYHDQDITGLSPYKVARLGMGFVPEDRRIFPDLTVRANLEVGLKKSRNNDNKWTFERVFDLFPRLKELSRRRGGTLSGGEQQMLTIARTLMGNPDLLLLDEPSEGLAPIIVKSLGEFIDRIKQEGMTVLLSEQNVKFSLKHSDRAYIVDSGHIKYQGSIKDLEKDEDVKKRYLAV
ncbi:ABC transporter ATP-binding protein [Desulfomonile tiedjei]|uniref:Amino acid/amide ABC transporter ATP-binding protein 2, HAAT family n=1 Tax=Desulfomonile tiedjei (strain ATCC 49306 / DSM 6799 / DCB-1) TaxID=706587 RepID=I4CCI8_DESTA|nr:ABC transporter ATP-binding protein [Desulfomonile tiedjei]AFM27279.1 amino acid/amide ABC transporter ATP-binding protein 2, HAAT family [Desulfomonile tiedjei DSM 6799]